MFDLFLCFILVGKSHPASQLSRYKVFLFFVPCEGVESSSDVALYSGLAAGVVTVVLLVVAVTLYRKSQSEYGVDVIDSSALTGGFQSFSFKSSRQGERAETKKRSPPSSPPS